VGQAFTSTIKVIIEIVWFYFQQYDLGNGNSAKMSLVSRSLDFISFMLLSSAGFEYSTDINYLYSSLDHNHRGISAFSFFMQTDNIS